MATDVYIDNFTNGYVVELVAQNKERCTSWLLLPAENLWPLWLRAVLYIAALLYIFLGIAAASDVFMSAIESITSTKKTVTFYDSELGQTVTKEVFVWNETVANLTLMALGSSAPEILLAIIETVSNLSLIDTNQKGSSLGLFTIIGSAAYNLLVITGICIISVPSPDFKRIKEFGVFCITSVCSIWAYVWMLLCAAIISPHVIDLWEALVTLAFFPLLVILAYCQDKGWWCKSGCGGGGGSSAMEEGKGNSVSPMSNSNGQMLDLNASPDNPASSSSTANLRSSQSHLMGSTYSVREIDASNSQMQRVLSRARLRHAAIRSLMGSSRQLRSGTTKRAVHHDVTTKMPHMTSKENWGKVGFSSPNYSVLESGGHIDVELIYYRKIPLPPNISGHRALSANASAAAREDEKDESTLTEKNGELTVVFETRDGTAKDGHDYTHTKGTVTFKEEEYVKTIRIPIIDDYEYEADKEFFIHLKCPSDSDAIGEPGEAQVIIIDDDEPGEFTFSEPFFYGDQSMGTLSLIISRLGGSDGTVTLELYTEDGSAIGGDNCKSFDFITTNEQVTFKNGELQKTLEIKVNEASDAKKHFTALLKNPSLGARIGSVAGAVCFVGPDDSHQNEQLAKGAQEDEPEEEMTYKGQFMQAMSIDAGKDDDGNPKDVSGLHLTMHFCTFFFKVVLAFIPPTKYYKAYPAFVFSLVAVGTLTAFVEQLGNLLGCAVGLHQAVTGISIVAIGTSLPDTFASRMAALHDDSADNSVGNVTDLTAQPQQRNNAQVACWAASSHQLA